MTPHSLQSFGETHIVPRGGRGPAQGVRHGSNLVAALVVLLSATSVSAQPRTVAPLAAVPLDAGAATLQSLTTPWADSASASDGGGGTAPRTVDEAAAEESAQETDAAAATVAAAGEVIEYYALDAVGSVRVVFDTAGTVVARADYMPFGETLEQTAGLPAERFTGQERDPEVGHDYFGARYYAARLGRFTSVDPVFSGAVADPQQWNRYAYARNSPLVFTDPSGLEITCKQVGSSVQCSDNSTTRPDPGMWLAPGYQQYACYSFGYCRLDDPPTYSPYIPPPSDPAPPPTGTPNPVAPPPPPQAAPIIVPGDNADPTDWIGLVNPLGGTVAAVTNAPKVLTRLRTLINLILGRGINVTDRGLAHVTARHTIGGAESAGKSIFAAGEDIATLIRNVSALPRVRQPSGTFKRVVDAGRTIGVDRATGRPTSTYTVITSEVDDLITAFPGRP